MTLSTMLREVRALRRAVDEKRKPRPTVLAGLALALSGLTLSVDDIALVDAATRNPRSRALRILWSSDPRNPRATNTAPVVDDDTTEE